MGSPSLSLSLSIYISLSHSPSQSLYLYFPLSLSLFLSISRSLSRSLSYLYLFFYLCFPLYLSLSAFTSISSSLLFYLILYYIFLKSSYLSFCNLVLHSTVSGLFPSVELIDLYSQQIKKNRANEADYVLDGEDEAEEIAVSAATLSSGDAATAGIATAINLASSTTSNTTSNTTREEQEEESELFKKYLPKPIIAVARPATSKKFFNGASAADSTRLATLIERFVETSKTDGKYYICDHASIVLISNWLHTVPLTLPERSVFTRPHLSPFLSSFVSTEELDTTAIQTRSFITCFEFMYQHNDSHQSVLPTHLPDSSSRTRQWM